MIWLRNLVIKWELWIALYEGGLQIHLKLNNGAERRQEKMPIPVPQIGGTFWGTKQQSIIMSEWSHYFHSLKLCSRYILNYLLCGGHPSEKVEENYT